MLQTIAAVNQAVNNFIWGVPAMVCIIGVGLLLSVRTGFIQIRKFPLCHQNPRLAACSASGMLPMVQ